MGTISVGVQLQGTLKGKSHLPCVAQLEETVAHAQPHTSGAQGVGTQGILVVSHGCPVLLLLEGYAHLAKQGGECHLWFLPTS